jgi:hypothetical protein
VVSSRLNNTVEGLALVQAQGSPMSLGVQADDSQAWCGDAPGFAVPGGASTVIETSPALPTALR